MEKEYKAMSYGSHIKRIIILFFLSLVVPILYLLIREPNEGVQWGYIFYPGVCLVLLVLFLHIARRITLGSLFAIDLNVRTVYELDKRNSKNKLHNLRLLANVYFFEGNFQEAVACCNSILQIVNKKKVVFEVLHMKILSLFFLEQLQEASALILQQREMAKTYGLAIEQKDLYYVFIEKYFMNQYEEACQTIQKALSVKNIEIQNSKKVVVFSLMRMAFLKLGKMDRANICTQQILQADKNHQTIFSKIS